MTYWERVTAADGSTWVRMKPCIFCGHTTVARDTPSGWTWGVVPTCPANGNGGHIRPGEYPDDVIDVIKRSRGLPT